MRRWSARDDVAEGVVTVDVDRLVGALRTERDRAMVEAMVLGGLRRCEVLGLRLEEFVSVSAGCSSMTARAAGNG